MWLFGFYRLYISLLAGIACWFFVARSIWLSLFVVVMVRAAWFAAESIVERMAVENDFKRHVYSFKQQLGPYGIRVANQAEKDFRTKKSLAEVFVSNSARLAKNVDQLRMLDTLFKAGMRPDNDAWLLHDCKLKYGTYRLEQQDKGGR
jgi:hypothetical protein